MTLTPRFVLRNFLVSLTLCLLCSIQVFSAEVKSPRTETDLSGTGWKLWLDTSAKWEKDKLFLPPVDLKSLPVNPPTIGWDKLYSSQGIKVSVPGTVEEYYWDTLAAGKPKFPDTLKEENRTSGDYKGVSWWWREIDVPASAIGKRLVIHFEAVRLRSEVFLNNKLVGYDLIGNTPFDVDITGKAKPGKNTLAVRVTDPSGNFDWVDWYVHKWGDYNIPASHGFGGIFQPVSLIATDPVYISDIFVKNKPEITSIDVDVTIVNTFTDKPATGNVEITISEAGAGRVVATETVPSVSLPGETTITKSISIPNAKKWDPDNPNLYVCEAKVVTGKTVRDIKSERFGFRFFTVTGEGSDAMFRLNGKRIFLQTAISWGFFPTTGLYPTEELVVKQIKAAKSFGMNMLNFHRTLGNRMMLDKADEMGLMHYEEPGGYRNGNGDEFSAAWSREKLLRVVKRDRNHPSLVIYNMINESMREPFPNEFIDMADAHKLDPSRPITFTTGWPKGKVDDPVKLHMLPYDDTQYVKGWWDWHHAPGPGVYRSTYYNDPKRYMLSTDNKEEIVFWGEEGAIGTPSRLELINKELEKTGKNGWDGEWYKGWYQAYVDFLDNKKLRKYFPTVDALTSSMGNLAMYYHGRIIENCRVGNVADCYTTNGWEAELFENHSGIVDCWRNPKGDPNLIARYNKPIYVAVKIRNKIAQVPATITTDFFIVNQVDLKGDFTLKASFIDPSGKSIWDKSWPVKITGGDIFGELLAEKIEAETSSLAGYYTMKAELVDSTGKVAAIGDDQAFTVDWKSAKVPDGGAVLDTGGDLRQFLSTRKNATLPAYSPNLGKLNYVMVAAEDSDPKEIIPTSALTSDDGKPGLTGEYFLGTNFQQSVKKRVDARIDFPEDTTALDPGRSMQYSVRWTGKLTPDQTGNFKFFTQSDDGVRLWIDGKQIIDDWNVHPVKTNVSSELELEAGKSYDIKIEYYQGDGGRCVRLLWKTPGMTAGDEMLDDLLRRVKDDGATMVITAGTERWAEMLAKRGVIKFNGVQKLGDVWVGGNIFVREHPLFKGLPVNQGMNWEYQEIIPYWIKRYGLLLDGEEVIAGTVNYNEPRLGTAVGIVNYGKGKIILSTLDMSALNSDGNGGADVVRKIMCNYIEFAGGKQ
ncbi:MAG: PA14 domain-containing protein [Armatimonadetes bacterium]|nr:PA14 domain-containing protein [Armatimonadota bacterium]